MEAAKGKSLLHVNAKRDGLDHSVTAHNAIKVCFSFFLSFFFFFKQPSPFNGSLNKGFLCPKSEQIKKMWVIFLPFFFGGGESVGGGVNPQVSLDIKPNSKINTKKIRIFLQCKRNFTMKKKPLKIL